MKKFNEYNRFDLPEISREMLADWEENHLFEQSVTTREGHKPFLFFEGPPSANGMPGIHHVMARTIKDTFCRFKTMQGYQVQRKAGWDTHGLPVELGVEKLLGITKEDIGKKISVDEYNAACRREVMKYTQEWTNLTKQMGYWVDLDDPYITYDNKYIETLWYLLKELYKKGYLYKGYTIQPYSPAAGTGLSSHELNQPGCYRDVKDTTATVQFRVKAPQPPKGGVPYAGSELSTCSEKVAAILSQLPLQGAEGPVLYAMAWTTTPWTLPSNTALCVGPKIEYSFIQAKNPYSGEECIYILASALVNKYFKAPQPPKGGASEQGQSPLLQEGTGEAYTVLGTCLGSDLVGLEYEQLIPWVNPGEGAFRFIAGDYVTTEDGTGIVHIAPTFGADDAMVAKKAGVPGMLFLTKKGEQRPMVDMSGKFFAIEDLDEDFVRNQVNTELYQEWAGRYVKNAYDATLTDKDETLDIALCIMLKAQGKAVKIEKHVHTYPHCWRTDKPVIYYPLDSWFIRSTAAREKMIELNNTINWQPESTGTGRFGKWLENLNDWNLSRSRYWGTPLPIWRTEDGTEELCIGSVAELMSEIDKAVAAGVMEKNPWPNFIVGDYSKENYDHVNIDLHRPYVDGIVLVSPSGKPMRRELDLIDVWFDSGAMPYAQVHYPFEAPHPPKGGVRESADPLIYARLKELAQTNRHNPTQAEEALWELLHNKNLGYKFRRQHIINDFIVDFVCLDRMLVVEVDGKYHNDPEQAEYDKLRTEYLERNGYHVIRFTNEQVLCDTDNTLSTIREALLAPPSGGWGATADFISEGVDQTRGWFFTLHAIHTMIDGSVAYKNVISNGLVLDKNGNKMSKRLGNAVDPFETLGKYGADPVRWYMLTNSSPWDNLKFDEAGVDEIRRKFFGTLYNTYSFFALYANVDNTEPKFLTAAEGLPEIDRWILSKLNTLTKEVTEYYEAYEPTKAGRAVSDFVQENLSNWYVRLNRKRFWGGEMNADKQAAYDTLYTCLVTVAQLMAPNAPFYGDKLYRDLIQAPHPPKGGACHANDCSVHPLQGAGGLSVHLSTWPTVNEGMIDKHLEDCMQLAQQASSMILALRRRAEKKVRQPLAKAVIPAPDAETLANLQYVAELIKNEVNVKELQVVSKAESEIQLVKKIKPNFKTLGKKFGKLMKELAAAITAMSQEQINAFEAAGTYTFDLPSLPLTGESEGAVVELEDVDILTEDMPGWLVANEGLLTIALDIEVSEELLQEGIARELVNRIQNIRKQSGFDITDKINIEIEKNEHINAAVANFSDYISSQVLANTLTLVDTLAEATDLDFEDFIVKVNVVKA